MLLPPGRTFFLISCFSCRGVLRLFVFLAFFFLWGLPLFRLSGSSKLCSAGATTFQRLVAGPTTWNNSVFVVFLEFLVLTHPRPASATPLETHIFYPRHGNVFGWGHLNAPWPDLPYDSNAKG